MLIGLKVLLVFFLHRPLEYKTEGKREGGEEECREEIAGRCRNVETLSKQRIWLMGEKEALKRYMNDLKKNCIMVDERKSEDKRLDALKIWTWRRMVNSQMDTEDT